MMNTVHDKTRQLTRLVEADKEKISELEQKTDREAQQAEKDILAAKNESLRADKKKKV